MNRAELKKLKEWLIERGVLNAQNNDLIEDAIWCCEDNPFRAKYRLRAAVSNLRSAGHYKEADKVEMYT